MSLRIREGDTSFYEFVSSQRANVNFSFSQWSHQKVPITQVNVTCKNNTRNHLAFLNLVLCKLDNTEIDEDGNIITHHLVLFSKIVERDQGNKNFTVTIPDYSDQNAVKCVLVTFGTNETHPSNLNCTEYNNLTAGAVIPDTDNGSIIIKR